jgi:hypothetical protein
MAEPVPITWTASVPAVGDFNTEIRDAVQWVIGHSANPKPFGRVTQSTPTNIASPSTYTFIVFDTTIVDRGGGFQSGGFEAPVAGFYLFTGAARIDASLGNKEIRLIVNGDENEYLSSENRFGIATPAFCALNVSGCGWLDIGDTVDLGVFCDAPTGPDVLVASLNWAYIATAA